MKLKDIFFEVKDLGIFVVENNNNNLCWLWGNYMDELLWGYWSYELGWEIDKYMKDVIVFIILVVRDKW